MIFTLTEQQNKLASYMHTSNNKVELFCLLNIPFNHPVNLKKVFKWFRDDSIRRYKIIFDKELTDNFSDLQQIYEFYPNIRTLAIVVNPWYRVFQAFIQLTAQKKINVSFNRFVLDIENFKFEIDILKNQIDYIQYIKNDIITSTDFIIRNEFFEEDFKQVQNYFTTNDRLSEDRPIAAYRAMYNDATKTKVAELFSRDIEHFGYTF